MAASHGGRRGSGGGGRDSLGAGLGALLLPGVSRVLGVRVVAELGDALGLLLGLALGLVKVNWFAAAAATASTASAKLPGA